MQIRLSKSCEGWMCMLLQMYCTPVLSHLGVISPMASLKGTICHIMGGMICHTMAAQLAVCAIYICVLNEADR